MTLTAYMTIDDSPTYDTDRLTDFLVERNVPAVLFCIGGAYKDVGIECQGIEQLPDPLVRAVEKGFVLGNHTYTHSRSSEMSFEQVVEEIEMTEKLIDELYKKARKTRTVKLLRFPQIDRGCGNANVVDFSKAGDYAQDIKDIFLKGLNIKETPISVENMEKKEKLQAYLSREGFTADIFGGINFPWYAETEMADAKDSLYTFSTADWMMNPDFRAKGYTWLYNSIEELKQRIDEDQWLNSPASANIVLAHDHNNMYGATTALIDHMLSKNIRFLPV
jgi:peptidoglycan/xylan/chitin deacetylase (PgdA/CDA1 family)